MIFARKIRDFRALFHFAGMCSLALIVLAHCGVCQSGDQPAAGGDSGDSAVTIFPHSETSRYWVSGQDNVIFQYHPSFHADFSGPNSLRTRADNAVSCVGTLFLGYQLSHTTEVFVDINGGGGLNDGLGLAGFTNLDVVRNPLLSKTPYLARAMIREIIPLKQRPLRHSGGHLLWRPAFPVRRLELRAGKVRHGGFLRHEQRRDSDSHFQFMNWTIDNNGAYDYAADTRGYTYGVMVEYYDRDWVFRFSEALMPKVANGIDLVWNLRQARAENFELELHPSLTGKRDTTIRLLSFINHANMGLYQTAITNFLDGETPARPDITRSSAANHYQVRLRCEPGAGFLPSSAGLCVALGWNEGQHESYAYTEVDNTVRFRRGFSGKMPGISKLDKVGAAFVTQTEFPPCTNAICNWAAWVFCWATAI